MTLAAGVCRFCGCSEWDPCVVDDGLELVGCAWTDRSQTVCSVCAPAWKAETAQLRVRRRAGYPVTPTWLQAWHLGFVVGWFQLTRDTTSGRNPYVRPAAAEAWQLGQRAGTEAGRAYRTLTGPIENVPRASVLHVDGRDRGPQKGTAHGAAHGPARRPARVARRDRSAGRVATSTAPAPGRRPPR